MYDTRYVLMYSEINSMNFQETQMRADLNMCMSYVLRDEKVMELPLGSSATKQWLHSQASTY